MMFITGPLYSGKRTYARNFRGSVIADVQDAADAVELLVRHGLEAAQNQVHQR